MLYVPVASAGEATHVYKGVTGSTWDAVCHWLMNPLGACVMGSMEDRELGGALRARNSQSRPAIVCVLRWLVGKRSCFSLSDLHWHLLLFLKNPSTPCERKTEKPTRKAMN